MKSITINVVVSLLCLLAANQSSANQSVTEALTSGKAYADLRLRYEAVDQNNAVADADALTLRTRLGYKTGVASGFSALVEFEDSRTVFGIDDYTVGPTGFKPGEFSVIADPETTELDQALIQYSDKGFTAKIGRQVITLDGHRFVGHVGWRQDRQTFDAVSLAYEPDKKLSLKASFLSKRNRIFAEAADIDSQDTLLNASYKTSHGKFVAYAYLLEVDNGTDNSLDTYGFSFDGSTEAGESKYLYHAEFATQDSNDTFDADYVSLEGGLVYKGITAKLGYESLGSDGGKYAFSTPLATLHKFNGWSDQFLGTPKAGLEDIYFTLVGKAAGGKWVATYHEFSADESTAGVDDLGDEINLQYSKGFGKNYSGGIKFASYSAGNAGFGKVDTDKSWVWLGAKF